MRLYGFAFSHQPHPPRQQLLQHALLDLLGFGEFGIEGGDFGIHVAQDFGDGGLFFK